MAVYTKNISYNGSTIDITVTTQAGTVSVDNPEWTNDITVDVDGDQTDVAGIPDSQLAATLARMETEAKALVDAIPDTVIHDALVDLGFALT